MNPYLTLTKPGIILGNAMTFTAGFFLAGNVFNASLFILSLFGLCCIVAASGVFNHCLERESDAKMERTAQRPLVCGTVSLFYACLFGLLLTIIGLFVLFFFANPLTAWLALSGMFIYLGPYTWSKYYTTHSTLIGSLAGAIPPLAGYAVANGFLDTAAAFLFLAVAVWQMPHFYAIALMRLEDYTKAEIPVLPVVDGVFDTKREIIVYVVLFGLLTSALGIIIQANALFFWLMGTVSGVWFLLALKGFWEPDNASSPWSRTMFFYSLCAITVLSASIIF